MVKMYLKGIVHTYCYNVLLAPTCHFLSTDFDVPSPPNHFPSL